MGREVLSNREYGIEVCKKLRENGETEDRN